jgi:hypothetical protein
MRLRPFVVVSVALLIGSPSTAIAQTPPKLHDINGFIVKGAFKELDPELMKRRLSLEEITKAGLNGGSTEIEKVLAWAAKCEKLDSQVEEPAVVQGTISIALPPNAMGDEAYTACFYAFSFNGLGLLGTRDDLKLVRSEKHPQLPSSGRPWNRDQILATQLFRLGYLKPDPILRQYRDRAGTAAGHSVLEAKSNVLIVVDTPAALETLRRYIDAETLEAMGMPAAGGDAQRGGLRPPSLGAIASSEAVHFYLMAVARRNHFPLVAAQDRAVAPRHYPEANVWMSEHDYQTLAEEYQRVGEFVQAASETGGEGWEDPNPARTFSPAEQKRRAIRFGLASTGPAGANTAKTKKTARKR